MRIFHDLLMLHGHIADPRLARELAGVSNAGTCDVLPARMPRADGPDAAPAVMAPSTRSRPAARSARAHFGRGVTTLCATALSLFR